MGEKHRSTFAIKYKSLFFFWMFATYYLCSFFLIPTIIIKKSPETVLFTWRRFHLCNLNTSNTCLLLLKIFTVLFKRNQYKLESHSLTLLYLVEFAVFCSDRSLKIENFYYIVFTMSPYLFIILICYTLQDLKSVSMALISFG